jgi:hypothetical protein
MATGWRIIGSLAKGTTLSPSGTVIRPAASSAVRPCPPDSETQRTKGAASKHPSLASHFIKSAPPCSRRVKAPPAGRSPGGNAYYRAAFGRMQQNFNKASIADKEYQNIKSLYLMI